jgi:hypothetical protein
MATVQQRERHSQQPQIIPLLEAVLRNAEFTADLVHQFLHRLLPHRSHGRVQQPLAFPRTFLLELGALLRLWLWEKAGFRPDLPPDLPSAQEALEQLLGRLGGGDFFADEPNSSLLLQRVLHISLSRMSWQSPLELGADVLLGQVSEEELVEAMAQLLWEHRRSLPGATSTERGLR